MHRNLVSRSLKASRHRWVSSEAASFRRKAIEKFGAPSSIESVLDESVLLQKKRPDGLPNAYITSLGCSRRVFLLDPHLSVAEMEGLSYRLRVLSHNEGLNSILIGSDSPKYADESLYTYTDGLPLPDYILDRDDRNKYSAWEWDEDPTSPQPGKTWLVSSGYDPLDLYKRGEHVQSAAVGKLMDALQHLAITVKGDQGAKIPIITTPHGQIMDSGAVFLYASYVMATTESSFRILNPSRGLTLDPVGLSYLLPRLGREFNQPSSRFPGCALILALMGYQADASDMMETGLATHFMESYQGMIILEEGLASLVPWNQQALTKKPRRFYNDPEPTRDHNASFRNVQVADLVHSLSAYRADGLEHWYNEHDDHTLYDPSTDFVDAVPDFGWRESDLVNYAATFQSIFLNENSVEGILERFREIAARVTENPEEQEGIAVAQDFVARLEAQSPLSLAVTYCLLYMGARKEATLESCMQRERKAQSKLFGMADFENWARHQTKYRGDNESVPPFSQWKHKSIADVTNDEVAELLEL